MIPWIKPKVWGNEKANILDAFESTWFSAGSYVEKFEEELAAIHGMKWALTTCNGTASLYLALEGLGLVSGDKVIVPAFGFGAAANMVSAAGGQPVFCDVDADTFVMCPNDLSRILDSEPQIKAVIPIHSYGVPCPMNEIMDLCKKYEVKVIEDCAESLFSRYHGRLCGTFGDVNSFSFQTTKTITTGEGGGLLTNDDILYKRMSLIRNHGMGEQKYFHQLRGNNFRLSNLLASMGVAQFKYREENIRIRGELYETYCSYFERLDGAKLQKIPPGCKPVMWAFAVELDKKVFPERDQVISDLKERGIETRPGFQTFNRMGLYGAPIRPISEKLASNIICLPFFIDLREEDINYIYQEMESLRY